MFFNHQFTRVIRPFTTILKKKVHVRVFHMLSSVLPRTDSHTCIEAHVRVFNLHECEASFYWQAFFHK